MDVGKRVYKKQYAMCLDRHSDFVGTFSKAVNKKEEIIVLALN